VAIRRALPYNGEARFIYHDADKDGECFMEKKLRVYIETSIISHLDAPDRPDWMEETHKLWKEIENDKYEIVIGSTVFAELQRCHEPKRSFMFDRLAEIAYTAIDSTDESEQLAGKYISMSGLPKKSRNDAMHIALATLADCDAIVSWNFSHIVNLTAMTAVNAVNQYERLKSIQIVTPTILLGG
jgi:predicted nucleic acid-binding protein